MTVSNSRASELKSEIANLRKKVKLSDSKEEIMVLTEKIASLTDQLKKVNRKSPNVVAVKDAKTIGDKIEARLTSKATGGRMRDRSVLL